MPRKPTPARTARPSRRARPAVAAVVLAAGKGTRMRSQRAKVLHEVGGLPMVMHPLRLALALGADPVVVVVGHQAPLVEAIVREHLADDPRAARVRFALQRRQRGTADAVRAAAPALDGFRGTVLVLYGDVPLLRTATVSHLLRAARAARRPARAALVTARFADPTGYGRIVRAPTATRGASRPGPVARIVEQSDASAAERVIDEINAGLYAVDARFLFGALAGVRDRNRQRELYLTDLAALAAAARAPVATVEADPAEIRGVNDRADLAAANAGWRAARNATLMRAGVTMSDPATTYVADGVAVAPDVTLGPGVALSGRTRVARGAVIGAGAQLHDTAVGPAAEVRAYSVCDGAVIGARALVGPYARLRPGAELGADVHVGNFVEVKKSRLGRGTKANHLTYLGDATVGARVNIGAGTITCNYDGQAKHPTFIEDGVFVGSNVSLVAPVRIGRGAFVGAGGTITKDVPAGALGLGRARQVVVPDYRKRRARSGAARRGH
ncbi:MAG TPA: bifunctional UDP-N-acetylglucosamine diphosphorylase/glucosamine-1-phosphate N-acetyltransferase GlmU [Myxococcota bacterium]|jgi:bifunctional UDP-N-acetylglucosamine pyrophosphorylase/glucosamine-1-phosphate N-acetyltransferase|nr:bifunctional UDP-N-acetylglucosamine diphosphorylase/glucosamine-1-phosphate N-acetyltransferase GlmU [Myxococcota bacterium]